MKKEPITILLLAELGTLLLGVLMWIVIITLCVVIMGLLHWGISQLLPPR